jgi:hypothetical protein
MSQRTVRTVSAQPFARRYRQGTARSDGGILGWPAPNRATWPGMVDVPLLAGTATGAHSAQGSFMSKPIVIKRKVHLWIIVLYKRKPTK